MSVKGVFTVFWLILAAGAAFWAVRASQPVNRPSPVSAQSVFYDKQDRPLTLKDFEGRAVLVNLWATWCAPCVAELPALARLQENLSDAPFQVVAIALETAPVAELEAFLTKHTASALGVYRDKDKTVARYWTYRGLPTSFLLNARGEVVKTYEGEQAWDSDPAILKEIRRLF